MMTALRLDMEQLVQERADEKHRYFWRNKLVANNKFIDMKNIAIYIYDYSLMGGAQEVTFHLAQLFHSEGLPIRELFTYDEQDVVKRDYPEDIAITNIHGDVNVMIDHIKKHNIGNLIMQVENLKVSYDIYNKISQLSDIKIVTVLHNSPYCWLKKYYDFSQYLHHPRFILQYFKMKFYWRPLHMKIFKTLADGNFVCVSKSAKEELEHILNIPSDKSKIRYIYNPVGLKAEQFDVEKKENILIYVGRLSLEKRTMLMLKLWRALYKQMPNWKFVVLGDGPDRKKMEVYIHRHHISNITFKGYVSNVRDYLLKSRISMLFSKYEGLPTGMLESCACGNALFGCYNDGGLQDILHNGENGRLCDAKDFNNVIDALKAMMSNDSLCTSMELKNKEIFKAFGEENIINNWKNLLN